MIRILHHIMVRDHKIWSGSKISFEAEHNSLFNDFIRAAYRFYNLDYPKFFKMDDLCKLGFVSSEVLLKNRPELSAVPRNRFAVVLSNSSSCLDSDLKFQQTIRKRSEFFPSPAVFVYTLPNIMIGEICIRNGFMGENVFFISEQPDFDNLSYWTNYYLDHDLADYVISGWVELHPELRENETKHSEALLFLSGKADQDADGLLPVHPDLMGKIYKSGPG